MKIKVILILITILLWATASFGSIFIADNETIISRGDLMEDDLYLMGDNCANYGKVDGDIIGFCNKFTNEGEITGSANIGARNIQIDGTILNSARIFGQEIDIYGEINKNLLIFGQEITLDNTAIIGRNFDCFGEVVLISGTVAGNVSLRAGSVIIDGTINGDLTIEAEEISILETAVISGDLIYNSPKEAFIDDSAHIGGRVDWEETEYRSNLDNIKYVLSRVTFVFRIIGFFMTLIMGYFMIIFFKNITSESSYQAKTNMARSFAFGLLGFLIFTIGALILGFTLIGIPIAIFLGGLGLLLFFVGKVFVAIAVGQIVFRLFSSSEYKPKLGWEFLIGLLILSILFQLPYLGYIIYFAVVLLGIGGAVLGHQSLNRKLNPGGKTN